MEINLEKQALNSINLIIEKLRNRNLNITNPSKAQHCYESALSSENQKVKLQVYFGKKGLKPVLQGNKEGKLYKKIEDFLFSNGFIPFNEKFFENNLDIKEPEEYIGIDESGKGDFFGPLVIASSYVNKETSVTLKKIGVKDSKELSDEQIKILFKDIKKIIGNKFSVLILEPQQYNQLYDKAKNLNKLLAWGHSKVIEMILKKVNCNMVIADKFGKDELLLDSFKHKNIDIKLHQITKGERYTAVAVSSIIARYYVIKWFEDKSEELKINLLKGGSKDVDKIAGIIKSRFGVQKLNDLVKLHFKNLKRI